MAERTFHVGKYRPRAEWRRPGKPEWPDQLTLTLSRRGLTKLLVQIATTLDCLDDDEDQCGIALVGELES